MPNYIDEHGNKIWRNDADTCYHRDDGPAIEYKDGTVAYYNQGQLHNANGPAVINGDIKTYWLNGKTYKDVFDYIRAGGRPWLKDFSEFASIVDKYLKPAPIEDKKKLFNMTNGFIESTKEESAIKEEPFEIIPSVVRPEYRTILICLRDEWFECTNTSGPSEIHREFQNLIGASLYDEYRFSKGLKDLLKLIKAAPFPLSYKNLSKYNEVQQTIEQIISKINKDYYILNSPEYKQKLAEHKRIEREKTLTEAKKVLFDPHFKEENFKSVAKNISPESIKTFEKLLEEVKADKDFKINFHDTITLEDFPLYKNSQKKEMSEMKNYPKAQENAPTMIDKFKADGMDAGYRVARRQIMKIVKSALINVLEKNKTKKTQIRAFAEFLTTELGESMMLGLVGVATEHVPGIKDNHIALRLAKEARVEAMAIVGNFGADAITSSLLPEVMGVLNKLGETEKKLRVSSVTEQTKPLANSKFEPTLEDEENDEEVVSAKHQKA